MQRHLMTIITSMLVLFVGAPAVFAQDWETQTSGATNVLNGVWFLDEARGYAVGNGGTVLETEDGGQSWSPLLLTFDDMLDVAFDGDIGLIVGDNGTIFRTTNAGQDWLQIPAGTDNNLAGVAFGAGGMVYAAGRDGTIVRSLDSGASWSLVETGTDRYRAVSAIGERAWAVGNNGVIRATTDGGANWVSLDSGTNNDLHDVTFVSSTEGWIAGQNNTVLYTSDSGSTWVSRNASIGVGMNSVFAGNPQLIWITGTLGNTYHSQDGAVIWNNEPTPTLNEMNAIHFTDAFHGWAAGENGTILTRVVPSVKLSVDRDTVEWGAAPGDVLYDLIRGDLGTLRTSAGDYSMAIDECLASGTAATTVNFASDPILGGEGFWFLVRVNPGGQTGSYDSGSFQQSGLRDAEIVASGLDCP